MKDEALNLAHGYLDRLIRGLNMDDTSEAVQVRDAIKQARAAPTVQEPVGEFKQSPHGNYLQLVWKTGYVANLGNKLYTTPPAQPAPVQPGRNHYEDGDVFERIAAMKKPAAPVQEPVAWINAKGDMTYLHGPYNKDDRPLIYGDITPHAAQPAPWVGLIDENGVLDLEDAHVTTEFIRGVLWAQSRLKEKNK